VYLKEETPVYGKINTGVFAKINTGVFKKINTGVCKKLNTGVCRKINTGVCKKLNTGVCRKINTSKDMFAMSPWRHVSVTLVGRRVLEKRESDTIVQDKLVKDVKTAAGKREALLGIQVKQTMAITEEELKYISERAESYDKLCIAAVAITGFYIFHRSAELVQSSKADNPLKRRYAADVIVTEKTLLEESSEVRYRVPTFLLQFHSPL
jgi:hypothetical protein